MKTVFTFLFTEIRYRLFFIFFSFSLCFLVCYVYYRQEFLYFIGKPLFLLEIRAQPIYNDIASKSYLCDFAINEGVANAAHHLSGTFTSTNVTEAFHAELLLSLVFAIWINFPFVLANIYLFFKPSFYKKQSKLSNLFINILFGTYFLSCYLIYKHVLPLFLSYFLNFSFETNLITLEAKVFSYVKLVSFVVFWCVLFNLLVVVGFFLQKLKWFNCASWANRRSLFFLISLFFALVFYTDIYTLLLFFLLTFCIFEFLILVGYYFKNE